MLEKTLVKQVSLVTGDKEFPEDLREKIQKVIATKHLGQSRNGPPKSAVDFALTTKRSPFGGRPT